MADVIAVTSGKGGVGKTTTAINLAVALRAAGHSTAVLDADLGMPNVGEFLGLDTDATIHEVLSGSASVETATVELDSGLSALPGNPDLDRFSAADPEGLKAVVESLSEHYNYVVVDTGGGLSYEGVYPLELADEVVLVTSPLPAAISDTKKSKQLADRIGVPVRGVVVTHTVEETDPAAIASEVGVGLLGSVPADPIVTESATHRQPVLEYDPESPVSAAYRQLAVAVAGEEVADATDGDEEELPEGKADETEQDAEKAVAAEEFEPVEVETAESVGVKAAESVDSENADESADGDESTADETVELDQTEDADKPTADVGEPISDADGPITDADEPTANADEPTANALVDESETVEADPEAATENASAENADADDEDEKKPGFFSRLLPFR